MTRHSITRRDVLAASVAAAALLINISAEGKAPFLHGGSASGGNTLFAINVVNDGASTLAANTPTDWFGLNFKAGDISAGSYFQLKLPDGTAQPFSSGGEAYFPDGSLLHANVRLRPTVSITNGASQQINVLSAGSVPSASGRTLTEVYSSGLQVNITTSAASPRIPSGNYVAKCGTGGGSANDTHTYVVNTPEVWADGPAGKCWLFKLNFFPADGSFVPTSTTADDKLLVYLWVFAANDGSNNLGGFHVVGKLCQPKYGQSGAAQVACSLVQYKMGATTINWPLDSFSPFAFKALSAGNVLTMVTGNTPRVGSVAIVNASTTGIPTTTLYYVQPGSAFSLGANQFRLVTASNISDTGLVSASQDTSGNATAQPLITVGTFGESYGINSSGNWVYLQGSGSVAASVIQPTRTKFDQTYFRNTKLIPPYDIANFNGATNGGTIPDQTATTDWAGFDITTWYDSSISIFDQALNGVAGDPQMVGIINAHSAVDYFNQSAASRKIVKFNAYARSKISQYIRDPTTLSVANIIDPPGTSNYTGFPNSVSTTLDSSSLGTRPSSDGSYIFDGGDPRHMPDFGYYAYLTLGRPELWDGIEGANVLYLIAPANNGSRNFPGFGAGSTDADYGNAWWFGEARSGAWAIRSVFAAAIAAPGKYDGSVLAPDGQNKVKYYRDWHAKIGKLQADQMNSGLSGSFANTYSYIATSSYWMNIANLSGTNFIQEKAAWQDGYIFTTLCLVYGVLGDTNIRSWANYMLADKEYKRANMWPGAQCGYYERNVPNGQRTSPSPSVPPISADNDYAQWGMHVNSTTWTTTPDAHGNYFTQTVLSAYPIIAGERQAFALDVGRPNGTGFSDTGTYIVSNPFSVSTGTDPATGFATTTYSYNLTNDGSTALIPSNTTNSNNGPVYRHPMSGYATTSTPGVTGNITMRISWQWWWMCCRWARYLGLTVTNNQLSSVQDAVATDGILSFASNYAATKYCVAAA